MFCKSVFTIVALSVLTIAECQPVHEQISTGSNIRVTRQMPNPMTAMHAMTSIPAEMGGAATQMANSAMKAFTNVAGGMMGGMGGGMPGGMGGGIPGGMGGGMASAMSGNGMPHMPGGPGNLPGMPGRM